ncbi:MAG: methyltransferase domain-containing protein [Candidatus Thiodiazotropha sp. (ex Ustalcina ferruginea)]|nr:methyltransferase domain-containing protein [Candidatus Thiodiazotropha sp. (ex Ustalcina ferruginea)]
MIARDPHRFVNELDEVAIERLISRLESRAKDKVFTGLVEKYAARLTLPPSAQMLEVGCGTGAMLRFLASRSGFSGKAIGVDQSLPFVEAASKFAQLENVSDKIDFHVGDAHRLDFPPATFDVVIANTLISHVTQPATVLEEMARVVRPGGTVAIFDGDYASLTYAIPDHDFGHKMDVALAKASFNNPRIMRDLPRLLPEFGLEVTDAWGDAIVEIGKGSYFKSFAETYAPYVSSAGLLSEDAVNSWLTVQRQAMENRTFFASCTYYTYLVHRV